MILRIGVTLALALTVLINYLAIALPIAGRTTGEISDALPTLVTPAGFTFAVWSVIYLGLAIYAIFQLLPAQRDNRRLSAIAPWFIASCAFNSLWILAWQYGALGLSIALMLGLLVSLVGIYRILNGPLEPTGGVNYWAVKLPFSLYLGWITLATMVNISAALVGWGWSSEGFVAMLWAAILIAIAVAVGLLFLNARADYPLALVLVWALLGIAVQHRDSALVLLAALAAMALLLFGMYQTARRRYSRAVLQPQPKS